MEQLAFHQRLRLERMKHGWSQENLAEKANVELKTVWRWEKGESIPRPRSLQRLCRMLDITPVELGLLDMHLQSTKSSPSPPLEQALDIVVDAQSGQEQNTGTQKNENSRLPEVQKSSTIEIDTLSKQKIVRKQHTVYLPLEISKWLKIQAIEDAREISEIVAEALEEYKNLHTKGISANNVPTPEV